ncbi:glycosyltransferase [Myxococcus sp. K38C18041901]|uniref:glycosyltransferase n=1 Tax=Myxococcus guangdongensis TaxID=2906760 RepID=UPI0020A780A5|nr:glycosyltransferase [Myxococcus guangdongensis]MCP3059705.1 glycosyltransferase [Myxococcus guangdongensis]
MRLAGYVIHGNNQDTLPRCLEGLLAVCDEVVALDSLSTDGSTEIARRMGARSVSVAWAGYGAARAAAIEALGPSDYVFFLDSDEHLGEEAIQTLRAWKERQPEEAVYRLPRRDWAEVDGQRFLYRTEWRARLIRRDVAVWRPEMIVHEALPCMRAGRLPAPIEHRFATSVSLRSAKEHRYALLWAVMALAEGRKSKPVMFQRPAHLLRDGVLHGALWRGGWAALKLAWVVAGYHAAKYRYLRDLRQGGYPELVRAFQERRYGELFQQVRTLELEP